ncbi:hypothetical protein A2U01_0086117, partial [Trifolium medium]|nr:hypothetical protein [Trifolium medium]
PIGTAARATQLLGKWCAVNQLQQQVRDDLLFQNSNSGNVLVLNGGNAMLTQVSLKPQVLQVGFGVSEILKT